MAAASSTSNSRRARAFVLFLAIVFAGDRLLALGLDAALSKSGLRFARLYHANIDADVLVLGNSRGVNCCYAPAIEERTGLKAFNLSYNGLSPALSEVLLLDYLDRHRTPKVLVYEISNALVGESGASLLTPWAGQSERVHALLAEEQPTLASALSVSALLRYNGELFFRAFYYLTRDTDQTWVNRGRLTDDQVALTRAMEPFALATPPENLAILKRTVAAAQARGIRVVLLMSPYWPEYKAKITNLDAWLAELEAATGAEVLDLSGAITAQAHFGDRIHLNEAGSRAFLDDLITAGALVGR